MPDFSWIDKHISESKPFAICAFPNENDVQIFDELNGNVLRSSKGVEFIITPESLGNYTLHQQVTTENEHSVMVNDAVEKIKSGTLQKVIISTVKHIHRNAQPLALVYEKLLTSYPTAFRYLVFHPIYGTWAGASPELLLKKEGNNYFTTSLAGTIKTDSSATVVWNEKLIHEQALVTEGIKTQLASIGVNELNVSEPKAHQAGPVTHLKTDFNFETSIASEKIIAALHPTAAVCGLPKEEAKALYRSLENHERRLYTGYLGVKKSSDDLCYFVNLRCMQIFDDHFELLVGGGITAGSIAKEEWEETEQKADTLKKIVLT